MNVSEKMFEVARLFHVQLSDVPTKVPAIGARTRILNNPVSFQPPQLACFYPLTEPGGRQEELALDVELENERDATSDWNEDDEEAIKEAADLGFPIVDGK
jgi:hypothetical protein